MAGNALTVSTLIYIKMNSVNFTGSEQETFYMFLTAWVAKNVAILVKLLKMK